MTLMAGSVKPMMGLFIVTDVVYGKTIFRFGEREIEDDRDESALRSNKARKIRRIDGEL